jgi:hypothetical protein
VSDLTAKPERSAREQLRTVLPDHAAITSTGEYGRPWKATWTTAADVWSVELPSMTQWLEASGPHFTLGLRDEQMDVLIAVLRALGALPEVSA